MKVRSLLFGMLCMLALGASLVSCSDDDDDSLDDDGSKVTLPQTRVYILNEGSQGANNAGLAFYAPNKDADFISDIYKTQNNAKLGDNLEGVAICEDMLYVSNSCTADYTYHNDVKVIDLRTFTLKETLTVASNPNTQMLEEDDKVFLISDDYSSAEGYVLQMIEPAKGNKVTKIGNATYMAANNDILYLVNSMTDWSTKPVTTVNTFFTYNIKTGQMNNASFLKDAPAELVSSTLHMLTINDNDGDIYISTSDFITNGTIYRFKKDGTFIEKFDAGGVNPNSAVFFN